MEYVFVRYISLSHLFVFSFSYFVLNELYKKKRSIQLLFLSILLIGVLIGERYSNIDLLFLFIMYFFFSLYLSNRQINSSPLLFSVVPYLIEIITSLITKPLFIKYLSSIQQKNHFGWFLLIFVLNIFTVIILTLVFKKRIYSFLHTKNLQAPVSFVITAFIFIYHTYWLILNYAESPFLKYLIIIFYFFLGLFVITVLQFEKRNEILKYEIKSQESEYALMKEYEKEIEKQYNEIRNFRHDYLNIVASLEYYIVEKNLTGISEYFESCIKPTRSIFQHNLIKLNELTKIHSLELRSLFATKLSLAQNKNININLEIHEDIILDTRINILCLIRIFAIILDNAIEELSDLKQGKLTIAFMKIEKDIVVIVQNTARQNIEPLHVLNAKGYSTKEDGRGLGLSNLTSLVNSSSNILLETKISNTTFLQKITIINGG